MGTGPFPLVPQYPGDFQTIPFRDELVCRQCHQAIDDFLSAGAFPAGQPAGQFRNVLNRRRITWTQPSTDFSALPAYRLFRLSISYHHRKPEIDRLFPHNRLYAFTMKIQPMPEATRLLQSRA